MVRLMAPLLAFTAEEIWQVMPHTAADKKESVFLNDMPSTCDAWAFDGLDDKWNALFDLRDDVMKALELTRADKKIGKSLDAKIAIYPKQDDQAATLRAFEDQLKTVFIVSGVELCDGTAPEDAFTETASGIAVAVRTPDGCKCDRCWSYSTEGKATEEGFLCARCLNIIEE